MSLFKAIYLSQFLSCQTIYQFWKAQGFYLHASALSKELVGTKPTVVTTVVLLQGLHLV